MSSTEDTKTLTAIDWIHYNALNNKYTIWNHNLHIQTPWIMVHIEKWMQIIFIPVFLAIENSQTQSALSQTWWDAKYLKCIALKGP